MKKPEDPASAVPAERPSKSQRKRDMHALQEMGEALVALPADLVRQIDMPEALCSAVLEAQGLAKHEARRRQMQYIGKLMRDADPAPIRLALDVAKGISVKQIAHLHHIERLREKLLADESVLTEIASVHRHADLLRLRQMRRNALKEREEGRQPRAYRELFRLLRELENE